MDDQELKRAFLAVFRGSEEGLLVLRAIAKEASYMTYVPQEVNATPAQHNFHAGRRCLAAYIFDKSGLSAADILNSTLNQKDPSHDR